MAVQNQIVSKYTSFTAFSAIKKFYKIKVICII